MAKGKSNSKSRGTGKRAAKAPGKPGKAFDSIMESLFDILGEMDTCEMEHGEEYDLSAGFSTVDCNFINYSMRRLLNLAFGGGDEDFTLDGDVSIGCDLISRKDEYWAKVAFNYRACTGSIVLFVRDGERGANMKVRYYSADFDTEHRSNVAFTTVDGLGETLGKVCDGLRVECLKAAAKKYGMKVS